jgi:hypothetical protein
MNLNVGEDTYIIAQTLLSLLLSQLSRSELAPTIICLYRGNRAACG